MSETEVQFEQCVRDIHSRCRPMVLAITGGGSQAIAELLRVPGGSQTVLEAIVPYAPESLRDFLRATPEHYCSARTARAMAIAAFARGCRLMEASAVQQRGPAEATSLVAGRAPRLPAALLGIGCTASLASDRVKRGEHRVHLAIQTLSFTETLTCVFEKGARSRAQEESLVAQLIVNRIASAVDIGSRLEAQITPADQLRIERTDAPVHWQSLLLGLRPSVAERPEAVHVLEDADRRLPVIFPGAFNPLHDGHREMMRCAERALGRRCQVEISIENVDKPPLDYTEIAQRISQFEPSCPVWLTRAPTFEQKSRLFPGATFVVGVDTIARIADGRYYQDAVRHQESLEKIMNRGCRFLVFGRVFRERFQTLSDLSLPPVLASICSEVSTQLFRCDLSSTSLRRLPESN